MSAPLLAFQTGLNPFQSSYNWATGGLVYFFEDNYVSRNKRYLATAIFILSLLVLAFLIAAAAITYSNDQRSATAIRFQDGNPSQFCLPAFVICSDLTDPRSSVVWTTTLNCTYGTTDSMSDCNAQLMGDSTTTCWVINEQRYIKFTSTSDFLYLQFQYQYDAMDTAGNPPYLMAGLLQNGLNTTAIPSQLSRFPFLFGNRNYVLQFSQNEVIDQFGNSNITYDASPTDLGETAVQDCPVDSLSFCSLNVDVRMGSGQTQSTAQVPDYKQSTLGGNIGGYVSLSLSGLVGALGSVLTTLFWRKYSDRAGYTTRESTIQLLKERVRPEFLDNPSQPFQPAVTRRPMPPPGHSYFLGDADRAGFT